MRAMTYSLNQIEHTARKAARAGGVPWGLADEVGKAVRWLHTYRFNGVSMLIALLDENVSTTLSAPLTLNGVWHAAHGVLDPLVTGAALSDCLLHVANVETQVIAYPLLTAGFVGSAVENENRAAILEWSGVSMHCCQDRIRFDGDQPAMETKRASFMRCDFVEREAVVVDERWRAPKIGAVKIDVKAWSRLEQYAQATYVEATDASRLSGAGAGLRDND